MEGLSPEMELEIKNAVDAGSKKIADEGIKASGAIGASTADAKKEIDVHLKKKEDDIKKLSAKLSEQLKKIAGKEAAEAAASTPDEDPGFITGLMKNKYAIIAGSAIVTAAAGIGIYKIVSPDSTNEPEPNDSF